MRKTVEILLAVLTVLLFATAFISCSSARQQQTGRQAASALSGAFGCTADVTLSGHDYTVNIVRLKDGDSTVQFVKPAELAPLSFRADSDGLHVQYGTLQANLDSASVPQSAVPSALLDTFEAAARDGAVSQQNGAAVLKGQTVAGPYTVTLDAQGRPTTISLPRQSLSARIYNFAAS